MPKIQMKTIWAIPNCFDPPRFSYSAAMTVHSAKEPTMPTRRNRCQSSHNPINHLVRKYIPVTETRKSGRRPTRSTRKAALIDTIKLRRVLPIWS